MSDNKPVTRGAEASLKGTEKRHIFNEGVKKTLPNVDKAKNPFANPKKDSK